MRCYIDNGDGTVDDHNKQDIDDLRVSGTRLRGDKNGEPNACNDNEEVSFQMEVTMTAMTENKGKEMIRDGRG